MKQNFDLHIHTTASDGVLSPSEVVEKALEEGLRTIAITDHDTVSGVEEALAKGREAGITVIPGVEISVEFSPGTMHMCGYFIDPGDPALLRVLEKIRGGRNKRNEIILEKLKNSGMHVSLEEVLAVSGEEVVSRNHIVKVMVDKGYAGSSQEAFDRFLARGMPCYAERERLSLEAAVRAITGAGGVAVMAHPVQLRLSGEGYRQIFRQAEEAGVSGVEAYASHHTEEENAFFHGLAEEHGFFVTGGSDYHGEVKPSSRLGVFGDRVKIDHDALIEKMKSLTPKKGA
ncbi:MAG: PHP domain-containing protein [Candidatus Omnitrophica bacterium]|nr:PHP domain-containing protein [Candidatus Omnitrophota bacterium]